MRNSHRRDEIASNLKLILFPSPHSTSLSIYFLFTNCHSQYLACSIFFHICQVMPPSYHLKHKKLLLIFSSKERKRKKNNKKNIPKYDARNVKRMRKKEIYGIFRGNVMSTMELHEYSCLRKSK